MFKGPARVFDSEETMLEGLREGKIKGGDVIVIRYEGPKGGPNARDVDTHLCNNGCWAREEVA